MSWFSLIGDRRFESPFLHRRVYCEPDFFSLTHQVAQQTAEALIRDIGVGQESSTRPRRRGSWIGARRFCFCLCNKKLTSGIFRATSGAFGNATRLASFLVKGGSNPSGISASSGLVQSHATPPNYGSRSDSSNGSTNDLNDHVLIAYSPTPALRWRHRFTLSSYVGGPKAAFLGMLIQLNCTSCSCTTCIAMVDAKEMANPGQLYSV